jgi:hypothetical protein
MKPEEVKAYFKSAYSMYKATGMSPANLGNWLKWGYVPIKSQHRIELITKGELKAKYEDC